MGQYDKFIQPTSAIKIISRGTGPLLDPEGERLQAARQRIIDGEDADAVALDLAGRLMMTRRRC